MLVTLTPGADRQHVLNLLDQAALTIANHYGNPAGLMQWKAETARTLRGLISRASLEELFVNPTFHHLLANQGAGAGTGRTLIEAEIGERQELLAAAAKTMRGLFTSWSVSPETILAVADTSVFLSHPAWTRDTDPTAVIASIPWAKDLVVGHANVRLVIPEVVIRELDRIKESSNKALRYRAQVTLAVLDTLLRDPYSTILIRAAHDGWHQDVGQRTEPGGRIDLKVFYDDPLHRPLADADAEIIDRALAVQTLSGSPVRLVTMDTGMALNARRAQLRVAKPTRPVEEPSPAEGQSTRGRRRENAAAKGDKATGGPAAAATA